LQRSLNWGEVARTCAVAILLTLPGMSLMSGRACAEPSLEARKLPMNFTWLDAPHDPRHALVAAVGAITSDTPAAFDDFAKSHDLKGATIVLDSSGGSVLDAIKLGRQWRALGVTTTVGIVTDADVANGGKREIFSDAYCESMCVFLLLSGKTRIVPDGAHVRVHQIWMGDRAEDATAASYTAQDVTIIERDVGRLAKYTFDMGGSGELLGLALSVPPWEPLHELTASELRETNVVTEAATVAQAAPAAAPAKATTASADKPVQDRFVAAKLSEEPSVAPDLHSLKSTKTAEVVAPTAAAVPAQR